MMKTLSAVLLAAFVLLPAVPALARDDAATQDNKFGARDQLDAGANPLWEEDAFEWYGEDGAVRSDIDWRERFPAQDTETWRMKGGFDDGMVNEYPYDPGFDAVEIFEGDDRGEE